jgi:hypothetical protein
MCITIIMEKEDTELVSHCKTFCVEVVLRRPAWNYPKIQSLIDTYPKLCFVAVDCYDHYYVTIWPDFNCFYCHEINIRDMPVWLASIVGMPCVEHE